MRIVRKFLRCTRVISVRHSFRTMEWNGSDNDSLVPLPSRDLQLGIFCSAYERPFVRRELFELLIKAARHAKDHQFGGIRVLQGHKVGYPYSTGAVVDVSLADGSGLATDMGSHYRSYNSFTKTRPEHMDTTFRYRRIVLCDAMKAAGFVNNPRFWWQFQMGTRYAAILKGENKYSFRAMDGVHSSLIA